MNGAATTTAVYGVQGVPSPLNHPQSIYEGCEFTDKQGNLWLFGGDGQLLADLWKFDPVTAEWAWMGGPQVANACGDYGIKGVPSASNWPGSHAYGAYTFVDTTGDFWLFGGWGLDDNCVVGALNDLWHLDLSTLTWTWMSGDNVTNQPGVYGTYQLSDPLNKPGARLEGATSWTDDNNNLWVFGGESAAAVHWNDMWKYDISTNEWAWMQGLSTSGGSNVYGTKGIANPANTPGARQAYGRWKDQMGNLWLFGGTDYAYYAADLWKYDVTSNEWTWMSGANVSTSGGVVGSQCISDTANFPPNRYENRATWVDLNGDFYLYGGRSNLSGDLGDLWKYCVPDNRWSLVNGTTAANVPAVYGTYQVSSPTNHPGGRFGALSWTDLSGNLWMFGGFGSKGDMWKFVPDPACGTCSALPIAAFAAPNDICPGTCTDFTNLSFYASSYQWSFPGGSPSASTDEDPLNICYSTPGSYDVTLIASNVNGDDTLTLLSYITVFPYPPPQGITQNGDTLFANQGSVSYQWYINGNIIPGATGYYHVAAVSGNYNVVCTDNNGCEVEAVIFDVIAGVRDLKTENFVMIFPNPASDLLTIQTSPDFGNVFEVRMINVLGETVIRDNILNKNLTELRIGELSAGIYYLLISSGKTSVQVKVVKH